MLPRYPDPSTGIYRWTRGEAGDLSKHFSKLEFSCRCNRCVVQSISMDLIRRLEDFRMAVGRPLTVTSGFRCRSRQEQLKKAGVQTADGVSQHELGLAADIYSSGLSGEELAHFAEKVGFKAIGIGSNWIHVDMRSDKVRRWRY